MDRTERYEGKILNSLVILKKCPVVRQLTDQDLSENGICEIIDDRLWMMNVACKKKLYLNIVQQ